MKIRLVPEFVAAVTAIPEFLDAKLHAFAGRLEEGMARYAGPDVEQERGWALALGLTEEQFDEVLALCRRFADERGWDWETFIYSLHTRVMTRGGAEMWPSRYWDVPHLSSLALLDPDHQEGEA